MANITGGSLTPIYNRLHNVEPYHPLDADTFADWSVEAGDVVTVTRDGKSYESPVHVAKMNWRKGIKVALSSAGNEERKPLAKMSQKKYARGGGGGGGLRNSMYQHIYVEDIYNQLKSGLELTTSTALLYVNDAYRRLSSGLELTSSAAKLYADNAYKAMHSELSITSSSIRTTITNQYKGLASQIKQQADRISLVVTETGAVNTASIVAGINKQSGSFVKIKADKINLSGYVTASQLDATNAKITNLTNGTTNAHKIWANTVQAGSVQISAGGTLTYQGHTIISMNSTDRNGNNIAVLGWRQ